MNNREYDYLFKLVIIGNSGVGKSSILLRFADDQFSQNYLTTIGVDFRFKTLPINGKNCQLQIWDTAGQDRFRTITSAYYQGADGIVIVYDTTNQSSFDDVDSFWLKEVESYADQNVDLILLGNKSDLNENQVVTSEAAQTYADTKQMLFLETSAQTSSQIQNAFLQISSQLIAKHDQMISEKQQMRKENIQKPTSDTPNVGGFSSSSSVTTNNTTGLEDEKRGQPTVKLSSKPLNENKEQQKKKNACPCG